MQPDQLGSDAGHLVVMWTTQPNNVWTLKDSTLSAVKLVEFLIQLDRRELLLPIGRWCLKRQLVGRFGRGLLIEHRLDERSVLLDGVGDGDVVGKFLAVLHAGRDAPRAVAENRRTGPSSRMRNR